MDRTFDAILLVIIGIFLAILLGVSAITFYFGVRHGRNIAVKELSKNGFLIPIVSTNAVTNFNFNAYVK